MHTIYLTVINRLCMFDLLKYNYSNDIINKINVYNLENKLIYTLEETKKICNNTYYITNKLIVPRLISKFKDKVLLLSIFEHTKKYEHISFKNKLEYILNIISTERLNCSVCNNPVKYKGGILYKYCENKDCLKLMLSKKAKERGMWMVQTKEAKEKKIKSLTGRKLSEENKRKIGESNAKKWTEEYKVKDKLNRISLNCYKKQSDTMKAKILAGEFTPKSENRKRAKRIKSDITGLNYRSNWELIFHENNLKLEYEKLRISYMDGENERIYITDFVDFDNKIIYEIKPSSELNQSNFLNKKKYTEEWCLKNDFFYKVITEKDYNFYGRK